MIEPWQRLETRPRGDFSVFTVREDRCRSPRTGAVHPFYVVESPDWVNCLPVTEDNKLVCIRQFRHGTRSVALELPGGLIDPGEAPDAAAQREMREETGYASDTVVHLGTMHPNPAMMSNQCHFYLAPHATRQHEQQLDRGEDIEPVLLDLADIGGLVRSGTITHGISLVGLLYLDLYLRQGTPLESANRNTTR